MDYHSLDQEVRRLQLSVLVLVTCYRAIRRFGRNLVILL